MGEFRTAIVFGCGTIGLGLAVALASRGLKVQGIDTDAERVERLAGGEASFDDRQLGEAFPATRQQRRLQFRGAPLRPSGPCAFIVCVPTPVDHRRMLDRTCLDAALAAIGAVLRDDDLLVIRSTVPIGTTRGIAAALRASGLAPLVACCPDRSVAGRSFGDQFAVPAIVGGLDAASAQASAGLFAALGAVHDVGSPEAAEAAKLFCNVQRDIGFAVANQFALICDALGLDFRAICDAAGTDYPRFAVARPGPVGGPCLAKDADLLAQSVAARPGLASLALAARQVNASVLDHVLAAILAHVARAGRPEPSIAVVGLAFKGDPPVADTRHGFGAALVEALREALPAGTVRGVDPVADAPNGALHDDIVGADVVVLANDHPVLRRLDLAGAAAVMRRGGLIYDACGGWAARAQALPNGVAFEALGRGSGAQPVGVPPSDISAPAGTSPAATISAKRLT